MISENSLIERSPDLMTSVIDNEVVILSIEDGKYIGLNEMGTEIWSRLSEPIKVSNLLNTLISIYNEDETIIKEQILEFLNSLFEKSIIKLLDESHT